MNEGMNERTERLGAATRSWQQVVFRCSPGPCLMPTPLSPSGPSKCPWHLPKRQLLESVLSCRVPGFLQLLGKEATAHPGGKGGELSWGRSTPALSSSCKEEKRRKRQEKANPLSGQIPLPTPSTAGQGQGPEPPRLRDPTPAEPLVSGHRGRQWRSHRRCRHPLSAGRASGTLRSALYSILLKPATGFRLRGGGLGLRFSGQGCA